MSGNGPRCASLQVCGCCSFVKGGRDPRSIFLLSASFGRLRIKRGHEPSSSLALPGSAIAPCGFDIIALSHFGFDVDDAAGSSNERDLQ
jgi:hypothetical protein